MSNPLLFYFYENKFDAAKAVFVKFLIAFNLILFRDV